MARIGARAADAVNRWIHTLGRSDPDLNGMACTLSALVLCGTEYPSGPCWGFACLPACATTSCTLLTTDHTLGAPGTTHALTRAVGAQDSLRVDHFKETAHLHDRYLICSDGVHGALSHRGDPRACWRKRAAPQETARELVEQRRGEHRIGQRTALVLDILALPPTQFADLELAHRRTAIAQRAGERRRHR